MFLKDKIPYCYRGSLIAAIDREKENSPEILGLVSRCGDNSIAVNPYATDISKTDDFLKEFLSKDFGELVYEDKILSLENYNIREIFPANKIDEKLIEITKEEKRKSKESSVKEVSFIKYRPLFLIWLKKKWMLIKKK